MDVAEIPGIDFLNFLGFRVFVFSLKRVEEKVDHRKESFVGQANTNNNNNGW